MLTVRIYSFSYIYNGIPEDTTPNGGGFVFDCRYIYNPGKKDEFKNLTGKDKAVIKFLDENSDMQNMLNDIFDIIDSAVKIYFERNFTNLIIRLYRRSAPFRLFRGKIKRIPDQKISKYKNRINSY